MGLRGVSESTSTDVMRFAEHTGRHKVPRYLLQEVDEQYVIVIYATAVLANGVMIRVRRARDFLGVVQNAGIFTDNLHPLARHNAGMCVERARHTNLLIAGETFVGSVSYIDTRRRGPQTARNCSFRSSIEVELLSSSET